MKGWPRARRPLLLVVLVAAAGPALATGVAATHADPVASVVAGLAVVLLAAKLGGDLATRIGQPAVLGELIVGVLLGNLAYVGVPWFDHLKSDPGLDMLARLGVLILLFEVGLESTVPQMLRVGPSALLVALVGVAVPLVLGWGVGAMLLPEASGYVHAFLGAALCATSVGITARVLQDMGRAQSPEARIILGAAVIDDVLGLLVLAVVSGAISAADQGGTLSVPTVAMLVIKAGIFLVVSLALGVWLSPKVFSLASRLQARGVLLALGLSFCFFLAWLADRIGLAPIVGAFAAGLILEDLNYRDFVNRGEHGLEELVRPISSFLTPVFFVVMGMRTDLRAFLDVNVLVLATALTVAAIAGKQACGLGVVSPGVDRVTVGLAMIPRGEVGLIFANIGLSLKLDGQPVVSPQVFSALVVMVIATTFITPPALAWRLRQLAPVS
jgi:Kef-type K+ transport system membrane component KefB